jgi:hypothetical protein
MGLFDSYFDPQQFQDSGGLVGRLLLLHQEQGQYQGACLDRALPTPETHTPVWPNLADNGGIPSVPQLPEQDLHSQYQALRPFLGDRNAMLATIFPDAGKIDGRASAGQPATPRNRQRGFRRLWPKRNTVSSDAASGSAADPYASHSGLVDGCMGNVATKSENSFRLGWRWRRWQKTMP